MNPYRRVVLVLALANVLVMVLFPPYLDQPLARSSLPAFAGYFPVFGAGVRLQLFTGLLWLQLAWVGANALAGWLAAGACGRRAPQHPGAGVLLFGLLNLAVILAFPPFETYSLLAQRLPPSFDGFYFAFGDRTRRALYAPMLHMELIVLAANVLAAWLGFHVMSRLYPPVSQEALLRMARQLKPHELASVWQQLQRRGAGPAGISIRLGRGPDRRKGGDAGHAGPERRSGNDRRSGWR
jgi:hypothetical protein